MTSESLTGSLLRCAKYPARVFLGRADPFRQREAMTVFAPYQTRIRQDEIYLACGFEPVAPQ